MFKDVEFTMPLRPDSKKRLNTSDEDKPKNSSFDSCYDTLDEQEPRPDSCSGDEEDPDRFLSQLGLETDVIKKINCNQVYETFRSFMGRFQKKCSMRIGIPPRKKLTILKF
jgi:hypothetical protein